MIEILFGGVLIYYKEDKNMILRPYKPQDAEKILRIGFVIVDDTKRGKGYGKRMIQMATEYAFNMLRAEKVTLGVFENNLSAYYCYKAAGFKEIKMEEECIYEICGEKWKCIELEIERTRN